MHMNAGRVLLTVVCLLAGHIPAIGADRPSDASEAHDAAVHSADDHGASDAGHGPSYGIQTLDLMSSVWTIVVFLLLLLLLRKYAWGPIQSALVQRERFIAESLDHARREREEAEKLLKRYTEQIGTARQEAAAIVAEARKDGEALRHRIEEDARKEAAAMLDRARREIHIAIESAIQDLYHRTAVISTQIAARLIRKEVSADVHRDLIRESIEELNKTRNN